MVYLPDMDCFLCSVSVLICSAFLYCTVSACDVHAATITEVFHAFSSVVRQMPGYNFLSCKANARVQLAKMGYGPNFPN
jgi:hypothetical protein